MRKDAIDKAVEWYKVADSRRWQTARLLYCMKQRRNRLEVAVRIGREEDTVDNLAFAYSLFVELLRECDRNGINSESIRNLRRRHPYTRWAVVCRKFMQHEFDLAEAKDWLENFEGGNKAMEAEIENKHGRPEPERRAYAVYSQARKMLDDIIYEPLKVAAKNYVEVYEEWRDMP